MLQDLEPAGQEFKDMLKEVEQASGVVVAVGVVVAAAIVSLQSRGADVVLRAALVVVRLM